LHFSIWATEDFQKNWSLPAVLFWQILPLFVFASCFLFKFFWSRNFWGSCYSSLWFNGCYTWVQTEPK
jgi:hypothetical protein